MLKNDRFIRALLRQPVDQTPVWLMRQAGRYLPEYRKTREQAGSFMRLCKNSTLACEVTLQPLARFDLDAAILFSDILTIPDAMGLGLYFTEGEGPQFKNPVRSANDVEKIVAPDPKEKLNYVLETIQLIQQNLEGRVPLIGFSGSPWTIATYMVEGKSSKTFSLIKGMLYQSPTLLHQLLDKIANSVTIYLNAQIEAGVNAVMIFDTWGGILSEPAYEQFSLYYIKKIVDGLIKSHNNQRIPNIVFTKGSGQWLEKIAAIGCDAVGIDWMTDIGKARALIGNRVALQGNMDPCVLHANAPSIEAEVSRILAQFGPHAGHVFNLGHGIHPDINPNHVEIFVNAVHEQSKMYHQEII